ncbi:hypothetical protein [Halomonas sp. N3-2A]|uniref:hypothetical protein n=1 Tax=Halomonas sp. N3-2A TaxID=2014541 RepID=UPI000B5B379C|nr:hypothetical protein [Halomonas sp. N3-2A]ASK18864.1 hypothetical protein CEK60_05915 [Halomonas sp. N3-2A]
MAQRNDWELIEREFRTGRFSMTQLEKRHGVHRSTISRRAKKGNWEKDLTERVRERTQQKITKASLSPEAQAAFDNDDDQIVEYAANENAAVVKGHRKNLDRWRGIAERYAELLESQLAEGKIAVELPSGGTAEIDVPLEYVGKCMGHGTQALDRVIKLERQNYGLDVNDKDDGVKSFEELMAEVAPNDPATE